MKTSPGLVRSPPQSAVHPRPRRPLGFDQEVQKALATEKLPPSITGYRRPLPFFHEARERLLPVPRWEGRPEVADCYWKAWELAWRNIGQPTGRNGFKQPFVRTAFDNCLYLWDSVFNTRWAEYGRRACDFSHTLDAFYLKQESGRDQIGFIPRVIDEESGVAVHNPHEINSSGPNVLAWGEWEHYLHTGDEQRLRAVFPRLLAYHRWTRMHRSWPDGSYYYTTISSGMDNQRRDDGSPSTVFWHHNFMTWIDAMAHALLSAETLLRIAAIIGRDAEVEEERREASFLVDYIDRRLWDEEKGFYFDAYRDGQLHDCMTIGAYWLLLTKAVPPDRLDRFLAPLEDPAHFKRPHRVPSTSASDPSYQEGKDGYFEGNYWRGCVWPPTNHMVVRGLQTRGREDLAAEIGRNHFENVLQVWRDTGTFWENYRPDRPAHGASAHADMVGWGGLGPIATLFECVFGLRPDAPRRTLRIDVRLTEAYQVARYPFGLHESLDIAVEARRDPRDKPLVHVRSRLPLTLELHWPGGFLRRAVSPGSA